MPFVAGVDSSTQSCKVEIRDLDSGQVIAVGRGAHPPTSPPRSEQDPNAWWAALVDAFGEVGSVAGQVAAIGVGGQQHGMVVLDANNRPLRLAKLWNDRDRFDSWSGQLRPRNARRWVLSLETLHPAATRHLIQTKGRSN